MLQSGGNLTTTSSAAAAEQSAADMAAAEAAEEAGERGFGGNRWPRQETVALLKIRSEMDVAFRDATVKGPLWEEVSRKLGELGYQRSAKKCKEKFENVYKYHKRTKEGRTGKTDGKTYRFFEQLQALGTTHSSSSPNTLITFSQPPLSSAAVTVTSTIVTPNPNNAVSVNVPPLVPPLNVPPATMGAMMNVISPNYFPGNMNMNMNTNSMNMNMNMMSGELFHSESPSSSSSTSSDVQIGGGGGGRGRKRKRKWKEFFERLTKEVVEKQEELQRRFLETVEKREHERMVREESWRTQEMARINRERELLAQERSAAAAKDAAVMAFLQKLSENNTIPTVASVPRRPHVTTPPPPPQQQRLVPVGALDSGLNPTVPPPHQPLPPPPRSATAAMVSQTPNASRTDNEDRNILTPPLAGSSRWPKVEIEALIMLRTNLDSKYQENGPKGPLWEEISAGMRRFGYNRNAKRCKEKWENINKYFKKVKESNKKRPEDSKTCPYFHQLEALYREKNNRFGNFQDTTSSSGQIKPENSVPLMVQPEQQWPPPPSEINNPRSEGHFGHNPDDDDDDEDDGKIGDDDEDDDDDDGGEFEIVPNNNNNK